MIVVHRLNGFCAVVCSDNLVARTDLGREQRVILAGHTDTVPAAGNDRADPSIPATFGLAAYLTKHNGAPDLVGPEVRATATRLGGELAERYQNASSYLTTEAQIVMSDWTKMAYVAEHSAHLWALQACASWPGPPHCAQSLSESQELGQAAAHLPSSQESVDWHSLVSLVVHATHFALATSHDVVQVWADGIPVRPADAPM